MIFCWVHCCWVLSDHQAEIFGHFGDDYPLDKHHEDTMGDVMVEFFKFTQVILYTAPSLVPFLSMERMVPASSIWSTIRTPSAKARQKSPWSSCTMALLLKMIPSLKRMCSKSSIPKLKQGDTGRLNCRMLMITNSPSINFSCKAQTRALVPKKANAAARSANTPPQAMISRSRQAAKYHRAVRDCQRNFK